ncbi:MATE family efflux transporter [Siminovitchia terrae]|uniref:Probable multidrug resistance protein NorM n=1 Tax=Siminovitchia terrae TaxID=1914933 RepID=A0A429XCQ4_SIMTE|nr:MATE family efflux transporter [Siminovitchia terrae]
MATIKQTIRLREKLYQFFVILVPILVANVATFSMSFFDVMMTGNYSATHLAGVAVGSSLWLPIQMGVGGILLSVTPIIAHLLGKRKVDQVSSYVVQTIYVGVALSLFIYMLGMFCLNPLLDLMDLEKDVRYVTKYYLISLAAGFIPYFIYCGLRGFIDALGKTNVTMLITLLALPINIILNYILIYGKFGFNELGGIGAGVATALTYWITTLLAILIIHKINPFVSYGIFKSFQKIHFEKWKEILRLGVPVGLTIFLEISIFSAVTLLMSQFGTVVIAAHQAALNFAYLLYMLPLSISAALTILVGFEAGALRFKDARSYSFLGLGTAVLLTTVSGMLLFVYRVPVAELYSKDQSVVNLTAQFLLYAVFFQLSDAFQSPIQGALRGYKDVNVTLVMSIGSYWIIGLPSGHALAVFTGMGPYGYWLGLIIGLGIGAITLSYRLFHVQKKQKSQRDLQQMIS